MSVQIQKPQEGAVQIDLSWNDAEVLCRAVGMVNAGNLEKVSPELLAIVEELVKVFGRNTSTESHQYMADIRGGQVYIENFED